MLRLPGTYCRSAKFMNGYAPLWGCKQLDISNLIFYDWTAMLRFLGHFSDFLAKMNGNAPFFRPYLSLINESEEFANMRKMFKYKMAG